MQKDYLIELEELRQLLGWLLKRDLLEELVDLRELLNHSYSNRYADICKNSDHGTDCGIAAKAKDLFYKFKEKDITGKIKHIYETYIKGLK